MAEKGATQPHNRDANGRFGKGNCANPGGRPKIPPDVKEMLKAATTEAAGLLIATMQDADVKLDLRLDCAKEIMNRVYGKAAQPIDGNVAGELIVRLCGAVEDYAG